MSEEPNEDRVELDEFHWHEALDRAYVLEDTFSRHVWEHPAIQQSPDLAAKAEAIHDAMCELYQAIGRKCP